MAVLTPALLRDLKMFADGMTIRQIASELHRSPRTIRQQRDQILVILGADNMAQAVAMAMRRNLIQ